LWRRKARACCASAGSCITALSTVVIHTPRAGSGLDAPGTGRRPESGLAGAPLAGAGAAGSRTADGVEMGRGLRAEGGVESGSESGTGGGNWAIGAGAADQAGAEGFTESGSEGFNEGDKRVMGAGAADRAGAEGDAESGTEGCKEGSKEPMGTAAAGRGGAEGCWAGPGGAIVVPALVWGWSAAAAGAARACGASRVSNSREQASPGRNAHRAALGEHRLGLEAAGRAGGRAMGRAVLRARTESPQGWQQDGPSGVFRLASAGIPQQA
jgi:hypothetical protein